MEGRETADFHTQLLDMKPGHWKLCVLAVGTVVELQASWMWSPLAIPVWRLVPMTWPCLTISPSCTAIWLRWPQIVSNP